MTSEELAAKAAEARRDLEAAAARGDIRAKRILAEIDGTAEEIQVDPKPIKPHWSEGGES